MESSPPNDEQSSDMLALQQKRGTNWNTNNVETLRDWLTISAFNIKCLEISIDYMRTTLRRNSIIGLLLSTLSGTLSITQFGISSDSTESTVINGFLTFFTFTIAISTGCMKIYQVQERLEEYIKLKQEWLTFSASLASEMQLPTSIRKDALYLIMKNKVKYLDLLKSDAEVSDWIRNKAKSELSTKDIVVNPELTHLPNIILNIGINEMKEMTQKSAQRERRNSVIGARLPEEPSSMNVVTLDVREV